MATQKAERPTLWVSGELDAIDEIHRLPKREQWDAWFYVVALFYRRMGWQTDREFIAAYEARRSGVAADVREGLFG